MTDNAGATHSATTTANIVAVNVPPVARAGGPYTGTAGVALSLNGATSTDSDGTIAAYAWNFGDGTTGTGATPAKTFATAGTFTVSLTVTDNNGAAHTASTTATIALPPNIAPIAHPGGPYTGTRGVALTLNGSASSDADGTIAGYAWNFGDGTTGTGATPAKTYATAGTFTVTLTVTDNRRGTHSATATATINPPGNIAPVARPGGPYNSQFGAPVVLDGSTSSDADGTIASYQWFLGDTTRQANVMTDDFNDNARDAAKWSVGAVFGTVFAGAAGYDPGITVAERNTRLEIVLRANLAGDRYAGFVTAAAQDFTGGSASVEVVQAAGGAADTLLCVSKDSQNSALMVAEAGGLYFIQIVGGQFAVNGVAYNPSLHRHWRIRNAGTLFAFDVSSNGTTWTTLHSETARFALTSTRIECGGGTWQPEAAPGMAVFDNFKFTRTTTGPETVATGASVTYTYPAPGTFTVRLKVTDNSGATHEAATSVTVSTAASAPASTGGDEFVGPGDGNRPAVVKAAVPPLDSLRGKWTAISDATFAARLDVNVAAQGRYTARVRSATATYIFTGTLERDGTAAATISRQGGPLRIQLSLDGNTHEIRGALHGETLLVELSGHQAAPGANPGLAGRYIATLDAASGQGAAIIVVTPSGHVQFAGKLAGRAFTSIAQLSHERRAPVFATSRGDVILGWLDFSAAGVDGTAAWIRSDTDDETVTVVGAR